MAAIESYYKMEGPYDTISLFVWEAT